MIYLFVGEDAVSKDIQLKKIRQEFLEKDTEQFNQDILFAQDLTSKGLQEKILCLPVKSRKRVLVIKNALGLSKESKEFLLSYLKNPYKEIVLILDIARLDKKNEFLNQVYRYVKVLRFKETIQPDTFALNHKIQMGRPDYALHILNQLLESGQRPERILGGLRFIWERDVYSSYEKAKRLRLLLNCDREIKTGRLPAHFALEKLVISLTCLRKPLH
jgi:DNA polymerase III delta subunit